MENTFSDKNNNSYYSHRHQNGSQEKFSKLTSGLHNNMLQNSTYNPFNSTITTFFNISNTDSFLHQQDPFSQKSFMIIIVVAYSLVFIIGLLGNSLVVYIVARSNEMRNPTYIFIANLALSDIVLCLLAVPFTPLNGILKSWVFGDVMCRVVPAVLCLCVHVSTQTSTAIAIERYFAIVFPFRQRISISMCVSVTMLIWFLSALISTPFLFTQTQIWHAEQSIYECNEDWDDLELRRTFSLVNLCLQYIGPCCIIAFCYIRVSLILKERARAAARRSSFAQASRQKSEIERKRRTNRMLVFMVVFFMLAWLPLNTLLVIWDFDASVENTRYFVHFFLSAHLVAMSSTVYNPFLYAWMNMLFKEEIHKRMPCLFQSLLNRFRSSQEQAPQQELATIPPNQANLNNTGVFNEKN